MNIVILLLTLWLNLCIAMDWLDYPLHLAVLFKKENENEPCSSPMILNDERGRDRLMDRTTGVLALVSIEYQLFLGHKGYEISAASKNLFCVLKGPASVSILEVVDFGMDDRLVLVKLGTIPEHMLLDWNMQKTEAVFSNTMPKNSSQVNVRCVKDITRAHLVSSAPTFPFKPSGWMVFPHRDNIIMKIAKGAKGKRMYGTIPAERSGVCLVIGDDSTIYGFVDFFTHYIDHRSYRFDQANVVEIIVAIEKLQEKEVIMDEIPIEELSPSIDPSWFGLQGA